MRRILAILAVLVLILFLAGGESGKAIARKAEVSGYLTQSFEAPVSFFKRLFMSNELFAHLALLERENENLRAQIMEFKTRAVPVAGEEKTLKVQRYATYPFNIHNLITIRAGADEGVTVGAPVMVESHLFLGQVVEVERNYSVVRTIFDDHFRLAVKIGEAGVEALLLGGRKPKLTLIDKDAALSNGQTVWTADREAPFGLLVGEAERIRYKTAEAFQEADVHVPYELGSIEEVVVRLP